MMRLMAPLYKLYEAFLWPQIKDGEKPKHLAVIMDGNRRYARAKGMETAYDGHEAGADKLQDVLRWCWDCGIRVVTLFAFSTENFFRPENEVKALMDLFAKNFTRLVSDSEIHQKHVQIKVIGRRSLLPEFLVKTIEMAEEATKDYNKHLLQIAIGYGGRAELVDAIRKIAEAIREDRIDTEEIDEEMISKSLYTNGVPDPDLVIRSSGEVRLSGFLLWQSAYSELYFCDVFFPSFRRIDLWRAIRSYQERHRRFGQ